MQVVIVASSAPAGLRWADAASPEHLPSDLAAALMGAGHDADVVRLPPPTDGGDAAHAFARTADGARWLVERLGSARPSVVHAVDAAAAVTAMSARAETGVPVVARWGDLPRPRGATQRRLRLACLRSADVVVAPTVSLARRAQAGGATSVAVVPDGVDVTALSPSSVSGGAAPPDNGRLVTLAGPGPTGGVSVVVQALRSVPDVELVVAGGPGGAAGAEQVDRLGREADRWGVAERVTLVGHVSRPAALDLLSAATAVVCPRPVATSGTAALEAMCRTRSVVAVRTAATADVVADHTTGLLVEGGDPAAMAAALRHVLADPFAREAWGQAGYDRVRARYDWSQVLPLLEQQYDACTAMAVSAP